MAARADGCGAAAPASAAAAAALARAQARTALASAAFGRAGPSFVAGIAGPAQSKASWKSASVPKRGPRSRENFSAPRPACQGQRPGAPSGTTEGRHPRIVLAAGTHHSQRRFDVASHARVLTCDGSVGSTLIPQLLSPLGFQQPADKSLHRVTEHWPPTSLLRSGPYYDLRYLYKTPSTYKAKHYDHCIDSKNFAHLLVDDIREG
ncbi:Protein of unknown function [Gryllus bimaculatus]|nr:Protein of unknown function [Gryllus bimaculatus]